MGNTHRSRQHQSTQQGFQKQMRACEKMKRKCQHCQAKFKKDHLLTYHLTFCTENPHNIDTRCSGCSRTYSLTEYQQHLADCEEQEASKINCEFCSKRVRAGDYVIHAERCSKNPINMHSPCQYCKEVLPNFIIEKHKEFCSQNPVNIKIICALCKTSFKKNRYDEHLAECENKYKTFEHDKECPICLGELKKTQDLKVLECFHQFHKDCISDWAKKRRLCPICRAVFRS